LAFAFATNCDLVLLDEPTNGLDIPSKSQLRKLLAMAIDDSKTFVISTHQVREVEHLIDPIVIIDEGKIVFNHKMSDITKHLAVTTESQLPAAMQKVLYSEKTFNGYKILTANQFGPEYESEVDLEMLFNAVLLDSEKINSICHEV
jgi:ABC-2 type transport system ATP-binding protein